MSLAGLIRYASGSDSEEEEVAKTIEIIPTSPRQLSAVRDTSEQLIEINDDTANLDAKKRYLLSKLTKRRSDKHQPYDGSTAEQSRQSVALFLEMDGTQTLTEVRQLSFYFLYMIFSMIKIIIGARKSEGKKTLGTLTFCKKWLIITKLMMSVSTYAC